MLTLLTPGADAVPWLGDLNSLGSGESFTPDQAGSFPVKPIEKRSYSQNGVVWIRQAGLQSDIQKILRHARKLPEKTQQFYKVRNAYCRFSFVIVDYPLSKPKLKHRSVTPYTSDVNF